MSYYISFGILQESLKKHYELFQRPTGLQSQIHALISQGIVTRSPVSPCLPDLADCLSDEEFFSLWDHLYLKVSEGSVNFGKNASEDIIIPPGRDLFCLRHFRYLDNGGMHIHDFFEMNYVVSGSCIFHFREEAKVLKEGQFIIIASGCLHDLAILDDHSVIITLLVRKSTFQTVFLDLLAQDSLLSTFFLGIFSNESQPNYLLFSTDNRTALRTLLKNLALELWKDDEYSNGCGIHWIHILLTYVLRHFVHTAVFYNYHGNPNIALILKYIQYHYRTLSLEELASFFHYTVPYLSGLIKHQTGMNYTEFIREIRMKEARKYLTYTDMKISEIADQIGYKSADHFSKIFKNIHQMSPRQYRQLHHSHPCRKTDA